MLIRRMILFATAWMPLVYGVAARNRKTILVSAVLAPVLLGMWAALDSRPRRALLRLIPLVVVFELVYGFVLYYIWLRLPWG
jgi:hypothetical protein